MTAVCVLCRYQPTECFSKEDNALERAGNSSEDTTSILLDDESQRNDNWDDFNHPRKRRALILRELYQRSCCNTSENSKVPTNIVFETPETMAITVHEECIKEDDGNYYGKNSSNDRARGMLPRPLDLYRKVHSSDMMDFLSTAWERWKALGRNGRDPSNIPVASLLLDDDNDETARIPPLIPCNFSLPRSANNEHHHPQRSSRNVMGQMGYFCNDICTPIVSELVQELNSDARIVSSAVDTAIARSNRNSNACHTRNESSSSSSNNKNNNSAVVYALCTHPGHHASKDSFGGYCYVNNAALAAKLLQERLSNNSISTQSSSTSSTPKKKIAILDVDYHCGNGTAFLFYNDPTVMVVSIHCHPDFEYPFHSGFGDEQGGSDAQGCTLHLPLLPGADWEPTYREALQTAGEAIQAFGPQALVVSLGLDTHIGDPCVTRGAGFALRGKVNLDDSKERNVDPPMATNSFSKSSDYDRMGQAIGNMVVECSKLQRSNETVEGTIPTIVVQEGGYELSAVPSAAADVLLGMAMATGGSNS